MAQILRDHFKTPKKHRGCHTQVEDKEKAAQQTLPEQSQPEAWSASPPKASTRFPSRSNAYLVRQNPGKTCTPESRNTLSIPKAQKRGRCFLLCQAGICHKSLHQRQPPITCPTGRGEGDPTPLPKLYTPIIGLQNELTKCGILKNMSDDEDFWKLVQEEALGVGTKEKLQKIKLKLMNPRPWPPAASRRRETEMLVSSDQDSGARQGTQQDHPGREQEVVEDGPEKERIKQGPHQPGLDPPKHRGDTASLLARLTEWRKRCQQHGAAQRLHRGPEESKTMCKTRTDSQSKMYLSRLYRMYSTSLANMEFSRKSKLSEHERGTLAPARRTTDPRPTAPLTLAHVIQTHPVVEAKTASRYWVNNVDEE
ncbi:brachyury 2 isoform X3 [Mus musculus]|uniref:brachyury 2 isoform X3 n=1 Tax=Mus musculus TaxID=10090 RepID=UPI001676E848|nr:brachyury 2 isoform X3 [Mus musculus]